MTTIRIDPNHHENQNLEKIGKRAVEKALEKTLEKAVSDTDDFSSEDESISPPEAEIPQKIFFRIGEVAALLKVKTSVLRFWETEFPFIHPTKSASGHRVYRRKEVEKLFTIKRLLYVERFSIEGAKRKMKEMKHAHAKARVLKLGSVATGKNSDARATGVLGPGFGAAMASMHPEPSTGANANAEIDHDHESTSPKVPGTRIDKSSVSGELSSELGVSNLSERVAVAENSGSRFSVEKMKRLTELANQSIDEIFKY